MKMDLNVIVYEKEFENEKLIHNKLNRLFESNKHWTLF